MDECLAGGGSLQLLDLGLPGSGLVHSCDWQDGLFDVTWSEQDPRSVVSAAGDGSLQLWDTTHPQVTKHPCFLSPTEIYSTNVHFIDILLIEINEHVPMLHVHKILLKVLFRYKL